jgi:hypothetical protein
MFQVHVGFVIHLLIMPCEEMTSKAGAVLLEKSSPQALFIISDFALLGIFSSYRFNLSNTCRINTKPKFNFLHCLAILQSFQMGILFSSLWSKLFSKAEVKIIIVGLDNAGKTTILYKL